MVVLHDPLFHLPVGVAELWDQVSASREISVIHIPNLCCSQKLTYSSVMFLNLSSTDMRGNSCDSTITTHAFAIQCLHAPRWKLCQMSKQKKPLIVSLSTGRFCKISGWSSSPQGRTVCIVGSQTGVGVRSSNGKCWAPVRGLASWPPRHRWHTPSQGVFADGLLATWLKVLVKCPIFPRAGKSPLVPKWTNLMRWPEQSRPSRQSVAASAANAPKSTAKAPG